MRSDEIVQGRRRWTISRQEVIESGLARRIRGDGSSVRFVFETSLFISSGNPLMEVESHHLFGMRIHGPLLGAYAFHFNVHDILNPIAFCY